MEKFKIAAVQMNALKDDLDHNIETHIRFIEETAEAGCNLVMFPELSVTAHYGDEKVLQFAEAADGNIFHIMHEQAKKHNIIIAYGFCEIAHGTHYNSEALVGPEGLIGIQRKTHASKDEYFFFRMGRSLDVFDLGLFKIGMLICYDTTFAEAWRVLALKGAEVILLPHASRSGWGKQITREKQVESLSKRLADAPGAYGVHTRENAVFSVYSNQADFNGHSTHAGGAYIIGPNGQVIEKSEPSLEDLWISAELDLELVHKARQSSHCTLRTRRPEVYGELTRMV
ncbi:carbon-nitrogen hydrolase family protein [Candidatus Poribacteria bacterium]